MGNHHVSCVHHRTTIQPQPVSATVQPSVGGAETKPATPQGFGLSANGFGIPRYRNKLRGQMIFTSGFWGTIFSEKTIGINECCRISGWKDIDDPLQSVDSRRKSLFQMVRKRWFLAKSANFEPRCLTALFILEFFCWSKSAGWQTKHNHPANPTEFIKTSLDFPPSCKCVF